MQSKAQREEDDGLCGQPQSPPLGISDQLAYDCFLRPESENGIAGSKRLHIMWAFAVQMPFALCRYSDWRTVRKFHFRRELVCRGKRWFVLTKIRVHSSGRNP
jgi:hypothetical protein